MSARKNRPVLFEVARQRTEPKPSARRPSGAPGAVPPSQAAAAPGVAEVSPIPAALPASATFATAAPEASVVTVAPHPPATVRVTPRPVRSAADGPPVYSYEGGVLTLVLRWPTGIAVAVCILLALLVVAFQLGRLRGAPAEYLGNSGDALLPTLVDARPDAGAEKQEGTTAAPPPVQPIALPPNAETAASKSEERNAAATDTRTDSRQRLSLVPGKHYLVIQHFRKSEAKTANAAVSFLIASGVPCALQIGGDIKVIAIEPFSISQKDRSAARSEQQRADALIRRVRELGKTFAAEHGYAFDQCYLLELKGT